MPYVPRVKNDIFISYAHADNTEGWVNEFETRLLNRLRQLERNAPFLIWRDPKLAGADVFSEEIYRNLESSAILISILSPNGLESNWCQLERERFERAVRATGGLHIGNKCRALKVTKTPTLGDQHRVMFNVLGYEFYTRSEQTGRFTEFHANSKEFHERLDLLAQEIYEILQGLRGQFLKPQTSPTVYVAAVSSDLEPWRAQVVNELTTAWNCRVFPVDAASSSTISKESITKDLTACSLSLHCMGATRPSVPENETLPIDLLQLNCARSAGINRIVCQIGDRLHTEIDDALKTHFDECIRPGSIDVLLQFLEERINSLLKSGVIPAGTLPTVYVVCSPEELGDALRLKNCLEKDRRFAATLPILNVDDEHIRLSDHRKTLRTCDAVLLYWGTKAKEAWFREQQREIIGARQKRSRTRPLPGVCLSLSPHVDPDVHTRPDLPFVPIPDLECSSVLRFSYFFQKNGDRK